MSRYMLDTNAVSHLLKEHPGVTRRVASVPMAALCISAVTEGELLFGLARRPDARRLHRAVMEFLLRVQVLPSDSVAAQSYGVVRAGMERQGLALAPLDLLIAAHALSVGAVMVTNDRAFCRVANLSVEDWTEI